MIIIAAIHTCSITIILWVIHVVTQLKAECEYESKFHRTVPIFILIALYYEQKFMHQISYVCKIMLLKGVMAFH